MSRNPVTLSSIYPLGYLRERRGRERRGEEWVRDELRGVHRGPPVGQALDVAVRP
jgi:hypothetical protein